MFGFLRHLFLPHHTNNQRAKLLHFDSILVISFIFIVGTFFFSLIKDTHPSVLGTAVDISTQELLILTNQQRQNAGLQPLKENTLLEVAASNKAKDMFTDNYWAHISPISGRTPWVYIQNAGYKYIYAGENLARGYPDAAGVVTAWMNSPSHRENVLSPNYQDVGFAVQEGNLTGEKDTILVVEMFGGKQLTPTTAQVTQEQIPQLAQKALAAPVTSHAVTKQPLIDRFSFAKNTTQFLLILFIAIFFLDMIIIERKKISRIVGHNLDHILFLGGILILIIYLSRGSIF